MRTLTTEQMREADRRCIEELGMPGVVLMNNAGTAVFREIESGPVGIVCGKGNNGGDGFVVARLALLAGLKPHVVLLTQRGSVKGDAAVYLSIYERLGGCVEEATDDASVARAVGGLGDCAILVDAMLGTGITGDVRGLFKTAIDAWPKVDTVAVDLPSGLNADSGEPCGGCIRADVTVTLQYAKRGFENPDAKAYLGRVVVADIGIPEVCADDAAWNRLMGG